LRDELFHQRLGLGLELVQEWVATHTGPEFVYNDLDLRHVARGVRRAEEVAP
jgi:hypothetical protein